MSVQAKKSQQDTGALVAVLVTLCIVVVILVIWTAWLGIFLSGFYTIRTLKPALATPPPPRLDDTSPQLLRVRVVNMHMLPAARKLAVNAAQAVQAGLFDNTDIVLVQEVWRPFALQRNADPVSVLVSTAAAAGYKVQGAVVEQRSPAGCATDSGLGAFSTAPHVWPVRCVAFQPFSTNAKTTVDALAHKGVAVFETTGGLRLATLHLQASYVRGSNRLTAHIVRRDARIRAAQFKQAVALAVQAGAVLLAGDVNTHDEEEGALQALDNIVKQATQGVGRRLQHDGATTRAALGANENTWRANICKCGVRIDHVWLLAASVQPVPQPHHDNCKRCELASTAPCPAAAGLPVPELRTLSAVTVGWTDHAALDVHLQLAAPLPLPHTQ